MLKYTNQKLELKYHNHGKALQKAPQTLDYLKSSARDKHEDIENGILLELQNVKLKQKALHKTLRTERLMWGWNKKLCIKAMPRIR